MSTTTFDRTPLQALPTPAQERLSAMVADIQRSPEAVQRLFPAAAREVGRGPLDPEDPTGVVGPTLDDVVRGALLEALAEARADQPAELLAEVEALYRYGDADEKRAVLRALPHLPLGDGAVHLLGDALRANDVRMIGAAMGSYATAHLDEDSWRQGVLKCLFVGVPLQAVHGLPQRADGTLADLVAAYAQERIAAGRPVPEDARRVLGDHPDVVAERGLTDELAR
ncbi:EboA domain-containing protein [Georgenia sp. 10Sc9-8]|uniref:EboA domain-containing protein n=1 Tax=Georgenia halotolerans TaxID=3028317 RepID=A0ABT5U180_9MICO|nr:EboA domain-containing protein [Georgenia halotolerans]